MSARDRFEQTRKAVVELAAIQALIAVNGEDWRPDGIKAGMPDPTANRAIYNVDVLGVQIEEWRKREAELVKFIGATIRIISGVRRGLGDAYASILEQRYIDGLPWADVKHDGRKVPKSTGKMKVAVAMDWIDSVGVSGIFGGEYEI